MAKKTSTDTTSTSEKKNKPKSVVRIKNLLNQVVPTYILKNGKHVQINIGRRATIEIQTSEVTALMQSQVNKKILKMYKN